MTEKKYEKCFGTYYFVFLILNLKQDCTETRMHKLELCSTFM